MSLKLKLAMMIFLLVFSIGMTWIIFVPVTGDAPDEGQHIAIVNFIRDHHRIPVFNHEEEIIKQVYIKDTYGGVYYSMAYNPPLGYLLYLITLQNGSVNYLHDVLTSRIISSLLISLFAVFLFLAFLKIDNTNNLIATTSTLLIALIPQVIFTGSYVNLEPFSLFMSALVFYFYVDLRNSHGQKLFKYLRFGLVLGILGLCKANYYFLILYFCLFALYDFNKAKKKEMLLNYLVSAATFITINSWWWVRNYRLFQDPLIVNYIRNELIDKAPEWVNSPHRIGYNFFTIFKIPLFLEGTFKGFYAFLGGMAIKLPSSAYLIPSLLLVLILYLSFLKKETRIYLYLFLITTLVAVIYFVNKNLYDFSPQGRHLFPILVPLAAISYTALNNLKERSKKAMCIAIILTSSSMLFYSLAVMTYRFYVKGDAYVDTSNIGTIENFHWRNLDYHEYVRFFDFIFSHNPDFFRINLFASLLVIAILSLILILILALKDQSNNDNALA